MHVPIWEQPSIPRKSSEKRENIIISLALLELSEVSPQIVSPKWWWGLRHKSLEGDGEGGGGTPPKKKSAQTRKTRWNTKIISSQIASPKWERPWGQMLGAQGWGRGWEHAPLPQKKSLLKQGNNVENPKIVYLVHPHLIYGIEVYANTFQKYLDPLIKVNNKILRILQNRKLNYPVPNLYRAYNTLPLHQLHNYFILTLLHKFKFNRTELPEPFWEYFTENNTIHSHNTRQIKNFHVDRKNTTLGQRSIKFRGGKLWNDIPSSIKLYMNKYILSKENSNFI